jgi:hypothetical protein
VPSATIEHVRDHSRRHVKETREVDGDQGVEVLDGVLREGLADVDAGVVDQSVDVAKAPDRLVHDALGGIGSVMSPATATMPESAEDSIDRAVAITLYPSSRYALAIPAPMPCEAPVTIATFSGGSLLMAARVRAYVRYRRVPDDTQPLVAILYFSQRSVAYQRKEQRGR